MWYDYNLKKGAAHNKKWYPSNLTPLYSLCHHDDLDLNDTMDIWEHSAWYNYSGGIPTSLEKTQQQWDLPNSWPPMVEIVVTALDNVLSIFCVCTKFLNLIFSQKLTREEKWQETWQRFLFKMFTAHGKRVTSSMKSTTVRNQGVGLEEVGSMRFKRALGGPMGLQCIYCPSKCFLEGMWMIVPSFQVS